ncbi:MAG: xylose isomerase [Planctomycetaceae bacterium]|jgi:xylose isomerase|nr:xylose isomerase [Planctomycetaceae bacterium]
MVAFPEVKKTVQYEGVESKNPLAFRYYNPDEKVEGKPMKDILRFSAAYWHTMRATGSDPFGAGTMYRPWEGVDNLDNALKRVKVFFEFLEKTQIPFYAFHDRDIAPEGKNLSESNKNLDEVVKVFKEEQTRTGVRLLWGTANLFGNPRFMHGAATSCNADVFAFAAAQVKKALEITKELGGDGYTFWGGREGYQCIWNTNMRRELDHLAKFMHMAVDYAKEIGFKGQFYFEPKPKEPTKHQYDFDSAACINFLRAYGLEKHVKMNIETNHATLAGHSVEHELIYAASQGFLGSVDANTGDMLLGWDTDQFPTNVYETTKMMLVILDYGGFTTGGLNFDAKVRRESFEPIDLFYSHIGGMDAFALGLKIAAEIRKSGEIAQMVKERYASWDSGIGAEIENGKHDFKSLENYMLKKGDSEPNRSGRQELFENIVNRYTFK